jgi:hypothetical protein
MQKLILALITSLVLGSGCADTNVAESNPGGVTVLWASLASGSACISPDDSSFRRGTGGQVEHLGFGDGYPSDIDRIVIWVTATVDGKSETKQRVFSAADTDLLGRGTLLIDSLDPDVPFSIRMFGCSGTEPDPRWTGSSQRMVIEEHTKNGTFILITPENKLACPTPSVLVGELELGSAQPSIPAAFSSAAVLSNRDVVVAGGVTKSGTAAQVCDLITIFDGSVGTFLDRDGALVVPRALAGSAVLSDNQVLIFGGTTGLEIKTDASTAFLFPGNSAPALTAQNFVESITPSTGESVTVPITGADALGITNMPLMSATYYDHDRDNLFVVGGYDADTDQPTNNAIRIHGLSGATAMDLLPVSMTSERLGPAILPVGGNNGGVVIFGGNVDGLTANAFEWISATGNESDAITPTVTPGTTVEPKCFSSQVLLSDQNDKRTYLVFGGQTPVGGGFTNTIDSDVAYEIVVDGSINPPTVEITTANLSQNPGFAQRAFASTAQLNGTDFVVVGGIAGLTDISAEFCADVSNQCLRTDLTVFRYDGDGLSVVYKEDIGPAVGVKPSIRPDGTILLSAGLSKVQGGIDMDSMSIVYNPLLDSDRNHCIYSIESASSTP